MTYDSLQMIFIFLPVTLALYYLMPRRVLRNLVLLLASLFFYAWGRPLYLLLLLILIAINFGLAIYIDDNFERRRDDIARQGLIAALVIDVGVLSFFLFFSKTVALFSRVMQRDFAVPEFAIPLGLTIFILQLIAYVVDVYRGRIESEKSLLNFTLFISMFPKIAHGPIERYEEHAAALAKRRESMDLIGEGLSRLFVGLGKVVILAGRIRLVWDEIHATPIESMSTLSAWLGIVSFAFWIYFLLSGYADMAIGLGKLFGFELQENFRYPYVASSVTDFWKRWHMSVTAWFREYIYLPLGGNRGKNAAYHVRNILIVWALTGLWYGVGTSKLFWGLYFAAFLILERYLLRGILSRLPSMIGRVYTFFVVIIGWAFFAHDAVGEGLAYVRAMFFGTPSRIDALSIYLLKTNWPLLLILLIAMLPYGTMIRQRVITKTRTGGLFLTLAYSCVFLISIVLMVTAS